MTTFFSSGCINDKGHVCDYCEIPDGRPTLYWEQKDFDLCYQCIEKLFIEHIQQPPILLVSRIVISETLRNEVFERDHYRCVSCGATDNLTVDHIIPFIKGGKTEKDNLQTLCKSCNCRKKDKLEYPYGISNHKDIQS